jgi:hypothetical protein
MDIHWIVLRSRFFLYCFFFSMHFAELDANNVVIRVIVADSKEWCEENLGGTWVRTYYNTDGRQYAGIGYTYHPDLDNFSSPQPYPSWTLNMSTMIWEPPVPYPTMEDGDESSFVWDEEQLAWVRG